MPSERLQKVLAQAGLGSRRRCEELIEDGLVTVNGEVATLGDKVDPETDRVEVEGVAIGTRPGLVYYLLNKPAGYVTTASDPQGRPTVLDLVPGEPRVFPVGRLDLDTEGLLILTNDGELAQLLMHPRHGVEKTYFAEVDGVPSARALRTLRDGVELDDGITQPARVRLLQESADGGSAVEVVVREGCKRMVRRMCSAVGHPVRCELLGVLPPEDLQLSDHYGVVADLRY